MITPEKFISWANTLPEDSWINKVAQMIMDDFIRSEGNIQEQHEVAILMQISQFPKEVLTKKLPVRRNGRMMKNPGFLEVRSLVRRFASRFAQSEMKADEWSLIAATVITAYVNSM